VVLATIPEAAPARTAAAPSVIGLHVPISFVAGTSLVFPERGGSVAMVIDEEDDARVVHGGREGKRYAAVGEVALSPDGSRVAHGALVSGKWHMVVDGVEGDGFDAVKAPAFSPDGAHVAYQAMDGEVWRLVVDRRASRGTRTRILAHRFSEDSTRIAWVDDADDHGKGRLVVSELGLEKPSVVATDVETFTLGPAGAIAYLAARAGGRVVVLDGKEEPFPDGELRGPLALAPGGRSVAALVRSGRGVELRRFFAHEGGGEASVYDDAEELVLGAGGRAYAFAARKGPSWFLVVDGREGPPFDRVVTPQLSPDTKSVAYRAREHGRRFVVVADGEGKTRTVHPEFDQVFPVRWAPDGGSIAYGVVQGRQVMWRNEAP
jgi:hypothetical protein